MAETQSNARLRADAGLPTSGVIHVRTRLTADFTVIANALAQRRGSAVTVGVAAYILSLPNGAPVSIAALCEHFTEGEILISRALRDLEAAGYLERRRERQATGVIRTRTFFYDIPGQGDLPTPPTTPPRPRRQAAVEDVARQDTAAAVTEAESEVAAEGETEATRAPSLVAGLPPVCPAEPMSWPPEPVPVPAPSTAGSPAMMPGTAAVTAFAAPPVEADPQAVAILASLRLRDSRLILTGREVATLAPRVTAWLGQGTGAEDITAMLTTGLPERFMARPARILAFRLGDLPVAVPDEPAGTPTPTRAAVLPWQTCDGGCERAFRAAEPGVCRDCRPDGGTPTAGQVIAHNAQLRQAC